MHTIEKLTADQAGALRPHLVELLRDAVNGGASIGFVKPLPPKMAEQYWIDVARDVANRTRVLLAMLTHDGIVGSVQLGLCTRPNGVHRAEVQKLLVRTSARRRGYGRLLMEAVEDEARASRRSLLYLDTESRKPAATMYEKMGWKLAGEIPDFASSPDGHLHGTMIFYKRI